MGAALGEGPLWHKDAPCWVDIDESAIHRTDPESRGG